MKKLTFPLFLFISILCYPQDYNWWNVKHNWDGITNWSKYIIISPALMGPNALPVPNSKDGSLSHKTTLEVSLDNHFSHGDFTNNLYTELYMPLFSDRVGLNISIVPIEYYKIDTITRDLRRVRDVGGEGISGGDFYIGTFIQIVKNKERFPDVLLTINLKTASGDNLSSARFTDSPGYFLDLSFGKEINVNQSIIKSVRPYAIVGFYAWQTNRDDYFQNDALLFGIGFNLLFENLELKNYLGGYAGYIGNGDKPIVYRIALRSNHESILNYKIMFQYGIRDFMYASLRVGCEIDLGIIKQRITNNQRP